MSKLELVSKERRFKEGVNFQLLNYRGSNNTQALLISQDNTVVGMVKMHYSQANNEYYFYDLKVRKRFRSTPSTYKEGEGYGTNLVLGINAFLRQKKAKGFLFNGVQDPRKIGLYTTYGWKQLVGSSRLAFDGTRG